MKNLFSFVTFAAIIISFAACNEGGINDAYFANWEGVYDATEVIETIASDGEVVSSVPARTTTITIFRDYFLYVQSYGIGDPFIPGVDPENHTVHLRAPKRMPMDDEPEDEEPEESGIEEVVATPGPNIILRDGGVLSIFDGVVYAPKAILAGIVTENELTLLPGHPFDVVLMSADNIDMGTVTCNWTYSPIRKNGDTYTWEAVLNLSQTSTANDEFNSFRHTLTMTKKPSQEVK